MEDVIVMSTYKTIQVTPKEYALLLELRGHLIERGTKSIEDKVRDKKFSVDKIMKEMERDSLAKGAVAGLAIAMALHLLRKNEE
jgi:hypothetical protein